MLPPVLAAALIAAGGLLILLAFRWLAKDWRTPRRLRRAVGAFYGGAVLVVIGLQPLRPFRMEYRPPYLLSPDPAARSRLLGDLRRERWIIGAARPATLVDRDDPLQPEVADRFARLVAGEPRLLGPEAPPFVFVGRRIDGWSGNPATATAALVFLGAVLVLSGLRHALRWM